ncbi:MULTISPECIES: hypothetical protein [unclassified Gluconobacter]|uniref:hypothetical protein n=1 Tax=unclassified Gluconobacter TaxID=2644261 RepID=UPI0002ED0F24|nr:MULTISPECIES: hypothetical protein [unclassified Gluconobacter]
MRHAGPNTLRDASSMRHVAIARTRDASFKRHTPRADQDDTRSATADHGNAP